MALLLPVASDRLATPGHSFLHRVVAVDGSSPEQSVQVNASGNLKTTKGRVGKITTVTDTYIVLVTDETVVCNKPTLFTVTLPVAVPGQIFCLMNIGAGQVTVKGNGTDTVNGQNTQLLDQDETMDVKCYVANKWGIV